MKKSFGVWFALFALICYWVFGLAGCEKAGEEEKEREERIKSQSNLISKGGETIIKLDQDTQRRAGLVTYDLSPIKYQKQLPAYGTVLPVQELLDLASRIADANAQLQKAQAGLKASRAEYDRLKSLAKDPQNVSEKNLQAAEAGWKTDSASAQSAQRMLAALEGQARQQWGEAILKWLEPGSPDLDQIIQGKSVLIQISFPAATAVAPAPAIMVRDSQEKLISASFVSSAPGTDPRFQGAGFFYLANNSGSLPAGLNLEAFMPGGDSMEGYLIPASAVIWWQGKAWVYQKQGADGFVRKEISTATPADEGWLIPRADLPEEPIVSKGAQQLLSEEFKSQAQTGEGD